MTVHVSIVRAVAVGLASLLLLTGAAQPASAKQDWLGWLEEFSGPGPFEGFELSVEFACVNVAHKDTVSRAELLKNFPQVAITADKAKVSLQQFTMVMSRLRAEVRSLEQKEGSKGVNIEQLIASVQADIDSGKIDANESMRTTVRNAWNDLLAFRTVTADALRQAPSVSKPHFKTFGRHSCWGASGKIDQDRDQDRATTAERLDEILLQGGSRPDAELYPRRRDWQTGLVVDIGWFWSEENRLFDPDGTRTGNDEEPQLRVVPLEFLAHHKLSPAIDVGAGLGVAFFHTDFRNDPWRPTKAAAFYLVPLSVVVRPGKLFTNQRWAAALGYRVGLRYFGDIEGTDFGRPPGDLLPGQKYFKQNGEFVWGAAAFFDLNSLLLGR